MSAGKNANTIEDGFLNSDTIQVSAAGMEKSPHVGTEAGFYCLALDRQESFPPGNLSWVPAVSITGPSKGHWVLSVLWFIAPGAGDFR